MSLPVSFEALAELTRRAGGRTLDWWNQPLRVMDKPDSSPVTAADLAAHHMILDGLQTLTPDIPVLSEEAADVPLEPRLGWKRFWLVDPLDGTKEFIAGTDEFTVNIALIEAGQVVAGIVGVPAKDTLYWGGAGLGAWKQSGAANPCAISVRQGETPLTVVGSRRHSSPDQQTFMNRLQTLESSRLVSIGSSLKFCLIAEGQADLYPRLGPTSQWDTAAAQAVVEGAGGQVVGLDGQRFNYPSRESWLNPYFVAAGAIEPARLRRLLG